MSQHDQVIANADGATVRADINAALAALFGSSSGATAPSTTVAYQFWADTANDLLKQRNAANSAWVSVLTLSTGLPAGLGSTVQPYDADTAKRDTAQTFTATQTWSKGADVASANALTLGADGNYFDITGTTAITSIGTIGVGTVVKLHFDAALTLTHHATDLILPGAANITTAAGDEFEFTEYVAGKWRVTGYAKASGQPIAGGTEQCKAWVNFNGTGTVAINASYNVSSITDNGTGDYTINFTSALADANYAWAGSYGADNSSTQGFIAGVAGVALATSKTASALRVNSAYASGTAIDIASASVAVFR